MVAELTKSIERQMSGRGNKKPAGGVDLGSTNDSDQLRPESRDDGRSPSPQIPVSKCWLQVIGAIVDIGGI